MKRIPALKGMRVKLREASAEIAEQVSCIALSASSPSVLPTGREPVRNHAGRP
jgi:hypothetical protein